jgi:hypothetical protein
LIRCQPRPAFPVLTSSQLCTPDRRRFPTQTTPEHPNLRLSPAASRHAVILITFTPRPPSSRSSSYWINQDTIGRLPLDTKSFWSDLEEIRHQSRNVMPVCTVVSPNLRGRVFSRPADLCCTDYTVPGPQTDSPSPCISSILPWRSPQHPRTHRQLRHRRRNLVQIHVCVMGLLRPRRA